MITLPETNLYLSNNLKSEIISVHFVQKSFILSEEEVLCNNGDIVPTLVREVERYPELVGRELVRYCEDSEGQILSCKVVLSTIVFIFLSPLVVLMISMVSTVAFR